MKIEVLVTTMFQKDFSKYKAMNLSTQAVFANQENRYEFKEAKIENKLVK